jgi:hypothetical protein
LKRPDDGTCSELIKGFGPFTNPLRGQMNTYELTTKYLSTFEVVENGPDALITLLRQLKAKTLLD